MQYRVLQSNDRYPTGIMANLPSTLRAKDLPLTLNEFTLPYPYNLALEQLAGMMQS